jgi:DNA-binding transcriptional MerR regulator
MEEQEQANLIRIGKASKIIGVSITTLRRWEKSGFLPVTFKSGRGTRYYSRSLINRIAKTCI